MSTQFVSAKSVSPIIDSTQGSVVTEVLGSGFAPDGSLLPIESAKGTKYFLVCFEDGCKFVLTVKALRYYTTPAFKDSQSGEYTDNPAYIGKRQIAAGDKLAMYRDENGRPVVKVVK